VPSKCTIDDEHVGGATANHRPSVSGLDYEQRNNIVTLEEHLEQGLAAFYADDSAELDVSLNALRQLDAAPWVLERMEGLKFCRENECENSTKLLWSSFQKNPEPQVLYELLVVTSRIAHSYQSQNLIDLLGVCIEVIRQCRANNFKPEWRARLEWFLGILLYRIPAPLPVLQDVAMKWRTCLPDGKYDQASFEMFQNTDMVLLGTAKRFFPFVMALAGMESDVVTANTVVAQLPGELVLPVENPDETAEDYSLNPLFARTLDLFIQSLPAAPTYERLLDLGCGYGAIGQALGERAKHKTGIDLNSESLSYAKESAGYDLTVETDIIEFLETSTDQFDLITACMVFDYVHGKDVVKLVTNRLSPGGFFAFTFIPAHHETVDDAECHHYYKPKFFNDIDPSLTTESCQMHPYMWSGGYYVTLQRPLD